MSSPADIAALIRPLLDRPADSHKGDFGRALLVGGSRGMSGAISLAGKAALRSGAGLVTLAVASDSLATVAAFEPSYMTIGLPHDEAGRITASAQLTLEPLLASAASSVTAIACGPGLGRSDDLTHLVAWLFAQCDKPAVFDADALNALAKLDGGLPKRPMPAAPRILTPHPGEFARLVGRRIEDRTQQRQAAEQFAAAGDVIVVLKGTGTIVTDGRQTFINDTGNPGMATGGTGDVLTGVITGLLCQGLAPLDAARVAVHVHGRAGDLAAGSLGQISLIASDLIDLLPLAFLSCRSDR
ncbi:MAG: NAD(P)H-hydrate dehydratase [Pirellulales bacterium]